MSANNHKPPEFIYFVWEPEVNTTNDMMDLSPYHDKESAIDDILRDEADNDEIILVYKLVETGRVKKEYVPDKPKGK